MAPTTTGGIPDTEEIILESGKDQWELFIKGFLGPTFSTKGIVTIDKTNNVKGKITITIMEISPPGVYICKSTTGASPVGIINIKKDEAKGIIKVTDFLISKLHESTWFFVGYINSKKNIPVIILYYEKINISIYSIIKNEEEINAYFSKGIPDNIRLN